jgi:dTDP-4-dehydrorhamnose reductase
MPRKILLTGASGQLGSELQRLLWPSDWQLIATDRSDLDLSDTEAIQRMLDGSQWGAVINAGAFTGVDQAETRQVEAWKVNALAPAALAQACAQCDIPLVHVSTDYVLPGTGDLPAQTDAMVGPLGVYGASKYGGELAVRTAGGTHAIIRTSWVMSAHGKNFVRTMLRLAREHDSVRVVGDQFGNPTSARDLAEAIKSVLLGMCSENATDGGTFHFCNAGATSWAMFAEEIFRQSALLGGPCARVDPIATSDYPTAAERPKNSRLDCSRISEVYGLQPRPWQVAMNEILTELIGSSE